MTSARTLSLGRRGEEDWQRLAAAYRLAPGAGRALVISDSPDVRAEVRRRFEMLGSFVRLEPGPTILADIHERADSQQPPIVWLEAAANSTVDVWGPALLALNRGRDLIGDQGGVFLMLAGDRQMHELLSVQAPDLSHVLQPVLVIEDQLGVLVQPTGPLCWMHLSDLHIRTRDWQQDRVLGSLLRELPRLVQQAERRPELLFVTGDVAYSGEKPQYEAAERFLERLGETLQLERGRVFVVPGNHDVARRAIGQTTRLAQESIMRLGHEERHQVVGDLLGEPDELALFGARLSEWCAFTQRLLGARGVEQSRPFCSDVEIVQGIRVGVASLCSAWMSGPNDRKGQLVLGARQVRDLADELDRKGAQIKLALLHHPLEWLEDGEEAEVKALLRTQFDLVLHGHLHRRDARCDDDGVDRVVWTGAGAAYDRPGRDRWHGFFIGQIDNGQAQVEVDAFTWTSHDGGRWHPDASFCREPAGPRRTLPFKPVKLGLSEVHPSSRLEGLAARLRQAAQRVYRALSFTGFPWTGPWPVATLTEIFIPPHLRHEGKTPSELTLAEFETSWLRSGFEPEPAVRAVIRGGPGSGKSTLCKRLAVMAAEDAAGRVPLLLSVRGWASAGFDHGLLNRAAHVASDILSVPVDEAELASLCESGHAVLIVDGVDETDALARETLRTRLYGFAVSYPRVPIVVTSRVLGYDEVRLDEGFDHLVLAPFDDDQIRWFMEGWYQVAQQPAVKAKESARELLDALDTLPAVKQLARTPLQATLIAALHLHRGALPGRRADLYQGCMKMLVESWPRANHRVLPELPADWQLARLEQLALWFQRRRDPKTLTGVLVDGAELESELEALLARRVLDDADRCGLARRWLRWLVDSSVLQEEGRDHYAFVHLSLMEYLAGQAVLQEQLAGGHAQVVEFVATFSRMKHWQETLLLMLGSRVVSQALRDVVLMRLSADSADGLFLLALLREELEIDDSTRDAVLGSAARTTLPGSSRAWFTYRESVRDLLRFSRTHADAIRRWIEHELAIRRGKDLLQILALIPRGFEVPLALEQREPNDLELVSLLELGYTNSGGWEWGPWVHHRATPELVLDWVRTGDVRGVIPHALENLALGLRHSGAWVAGLQRRMCWQARNLGESRSTVHWRSASCNLDIEESSSLRCTGVGREHEPRIDNAGYLSTAFWDAWFSFGLALQRIKPSQLPERAYRSFGRFSQTRWVESNVGGLMPRDPAEQIDPNILADSLTNLAQRVYSSTSARIPPGLVIPNLSPAPNPSRPPPNAPPAQPWTLKAPLADPLPDTWPMLVAFFATFHAGARSARDPVIANIVGETCVQNLAINLFFDGIVEIAGRHPLTPDRQALLLALGLAQFQTTWRWPLSPRWQQWFADDTPPEHWLSAYVWHLCWAVAEPQTPNHVERAHACLDRSDWPDLAAALREHSVIPTQD